MLRRLDPIVEQAAGDDGLGLRDRRGTPRQSVEQRPVSRYRAEVIEALEAARVCMRDGDVSG